MNDTLRDLMSGRRRGVVPSAVRAALGLAEVGYGLGVGWRNRRYDRGAGVHRAAAPVVSVGNLTAGGTGKTPVVALLANHFRRRGVNIALLSRGYRSLGDDLPSPLREAGGFIPPGQARRLGPRGRETTNDEARVLEHLCPGVPHLQQPDRVAAAAEAVARFGSELLILDDGFQHRRLARDLDIVLIDATNPFGYGHLLPRGLLREPVASLRRADLVLLTRADAVTDEAKQATLRTIRRAAPKVPIVEVVFPPAGLVNASGIRRPLDALGDIPALAFCGIGNPAGFAATLAAAGIRSAELVAFPDHHHYGPEDLARLARRADVCGVGAAVTTLKDLVKIRNDALPPPAGVPLWAVETGCEAIRNGSVLFERLDALAGRVAGRRAA